MDISKTNIFTVFQCFMKYDILLNPDNRELLVSLYRADKAKLSVHLKLCITGSNTICHTTDIGCKAFEPQLDTLLQLILNNRKTAKFFL